MPGHAFFGGEPFGGEGGGGGDSWDPLSDLLGQGAAVIDIGALIGQHQFAGSANPVEAGFATASQEIEKALRGVAPFEPSALESFTLDDEPRSQDVGRALAALEEENRGLRSQIEQIYTERMRKMQLFKDVMSGAVYFLLQKYEPGALTGRAPIAQSSDWLLKSAQDLAGRVKAAGQKPTIPSHSGWFGAEFPNLETERF